MASSYRRWVLLAGWVAVTRAVVGCNDRPDQEQTAPRLLDQLCRPPSSNCKLSGSARLTTGLTEDSIGVQIGPSPGALHVRWPGLSGAAGSGGGAGASVGSSSGEPGSQSFQALARGTGRLTSSPSSSALGESFDWREFARTASFDGEPGFLLVAESNGGSEVEVVDVRETREIVYDCSVAAVGRRR